MVTASRAVFLGVLGAVILATPANAANLLADYQFDNSRASSVAGAPAVTDIVKTGNAANAFATEVVNGQPNRVLTFPEGNGVSLAIADLIPPFARSHWSVVVELRLTTVSGYRRVLAPNGAIEDGLYVLARQLDWYTAGTQTKDHLGSTPTLFTADAYVEVAFTSGTDNVRVYANGAQEIDVFGSGVGLSADGITFFKDNGDEHSAGAVSRIRLYDAELTAQEVAAIAAVTDPPSDVDFDGVVESADNCPSVANSDQANGDGDSQGDACDDDDDADGVPDGSDNCPLAGGADQTDTDADGQGDVCDSDDDADGVADGSDNCRTLANADGADVDADGEGDACDTDDDGDGVADGSDNCPAASNPDKADLDGDGLGNACDPDDDNDGVADASDNCALSAVQIDSDRDGLADPCDPDDDGDGVRDALDGCPLFARVGLTGCPSARLRKTGPVRTRRAGKRGVKLITGIEATCPRTPLRCAVAGSVGRLGRTKARLRPGTKRVIAVKLTKEGAAALRESGKLRVKITIRLTGPDGKVVRVIRTARITAPGG